MSQGPAIKNDLCVAHSAAGPIASELNGSLIRIVNVDDLKSYLNHRSSDTGHIVFTVHDANILVEHHILIIEGKPVAAYSGNSPLCGSALIEALNGVAGTAEYYFIEEQTIRSVLDTYPRIASTEEIEPGRQALSDEKKAGGASDPGPGEATVRDAVPEMPAASEPAISGEGTAAEKPDGQCSPAIGLAPSGMMKPVPVAFEPASMRIPEGGEKGAIAEKRVGSASKLENLLKRLKLFR